MGATRKRRRHRGHFSRPAPGVVLSLALIALAGAAAAAERGRAGYDYLTLVLSWSPSYCAATAGRGDAGQCAPGRRYAFVVHGLWPQYERGWPDYCPGRQRLPAALVDGMRDIMPSAGLVVHEWRKHGTCSGLGPAEYFATLRRLYERVRIPARYLSPTTTIVTTPAGLEEDFVKSNRWLRREMISLHCGNRRDSAHLAELRLCFTRQLAPRPCGVNERRACRARQLVLPPVR